MYNREMKEGMRNIKAIKLSKEGLLQWWKRWAEGDWNRNIETIRRETGECDRKTSSVYQKHIYVRIHLAEATGWLNQRFHLMGGDQLPSCSNALFVKHNLSENVISISHGARREGGLQREGLASRIYPVLPVRLSATALSTPRNNHNNPLSTFIFLHLTHNNTLLDLKLQFDNIYTRKHEKRGRNRQVGKNKKAFSAHLAVYQNFEVRFGSRRVAFVFRQFWNICESKNSPQVSTALKIKAKFGIFATYLI